MVGTAFASIFLGAGSCSKTYLSLLIVGVSPLRFTMSNCSLVRLLGATITPERLEATDLIDLIDLIELFYSDCD